MSTIVGLGRPWLGLAVRRILEEPALIGAAFVVALVATTVAAACVVYPDTMLRRGLVEALGGTDPASTAVVVSLDAPSAAADATDATVVAAIRAALGPGAGSLVRTARSASWALPGGEGLAYPPLTVLASDDGIETRSTLVEGAWPKEGSRGSVEAVVTTGAAEALGLEVGSIVEVASRRTAGRLLDVLVSGIVRVDDPDDPAWGGDRLAVEGAAQPGSFPLRGPLFVSRQALLEQAGREDVTLGWRAEPDFGRIGPEDVGSIRAGTAGLEERLERDLGTGDPVTVSTGLTTALDRAGRGLAAGRGGVAIIALQLLVLAAYGLVLVASLVADQRRAATDLAAARGAPAATVVGLAALEGALVAVPAVVLGPLLAVLLAGALAGGGGGPAAAAFAVPGPRLTTDTLGLALVAGLVIVVAMALPAAGALGPVARLRSRLAGRGTRDPGERTGIDLALLALAALGLWQLHENGSRLARSGGAGGGVDPLLAIAPAVGLLAGGLLALRIGPLLGSWLERPAEAASGAVTALAGRGVARRSAEAGRAALLVVVATALVLFTIAYGRTWTVSQADQIAAALPAAGVGAASSGPAGRPDWAIADALGAVPGVDEAVPVSSETFSIGTAVTRGTLLAAPAEATGRFVQAGRDTGGRPLAELVGSLADARPTVSVVAVPAAADVVGLDVDARLVAAPGADGRTRAIPATWLGLVPSLVVRDGTGVLHRLSGPAGRLTGGRQTLEIPLTIDVDGRRVRLAGPVDIVGVELELSLPDGVAAGGTIGLDGMAAGAAGSGDDGERGELDLGTAAAWQAVRGGFGISPEPLAQDRARPLAVDLAEPVVGPVPTVIGFRSSPPEGADEALPAVVDASTAAAAGVAPGDVVPVSRGPGDVLRVRVDHVVDLLPGVAPGTSGILVDLPTLALADYRAAGTLPAPDAWWLGIAAGADPAAVAAGATAAGLDDVRIRAALLEGRLADPLARGVLGALELAAVAALLIAAVGFGVASWRSVRVRRMERGIARALGLERDQTAGWLTLELAYQLVLGIGGGILVGIALAWAVLPSVAVTPDGSVAVPAPTVVMPWDLVVAMVVAGIAVLLAMLVPLRLADRGADLASILREAQP